MKSGRFIGVMSGTSLDGVDVVHLQAHVEVADVFHMAGQAAL